jgi:hypothetical protein
MSETRDKYDIKLAGMGFFVEPDTYHERGRTEAIDRQQAEAPGGELDFGPHWPYHQRSWLLGEQQRFTHEYDEQQHTAVRRYWSGHGWDNSIEGQLSLLPALAVSKSSITVTTCPMAVNLTGSVLYAFPVGTTCHKWNGTTWTSETVTDAVSPIVDVVNAGNELYAVDSNTVGSRVLKRDSAGTWSRVTTDEEGWSYDDATAVVWTNGELYVLTPDELYAHDAAEVACEWTGGTIAATHEGGVFWSDGSNRVYLYNGVGSRLMIPGLAPDFQVQNLFSAHSRLWICGVFSNGNAGVYWYTNGVHGVLGWFPTSGTATRDIKAVTADAEHVIFSDPLYGGSIRHYAPEGGWSHYLALGSAAAIPYKGMARVAGRTVIAMKPTTGTEGIYVDSTTAYAAGATLESSLIDLQMPAHEKLWQGIVLQTQPLTAGMKIEVQVSIDGGVTWKSLGYMEGANLSHRWFSVEMQSPTLAYRIIGPSASGTATPKVLAVSVYGDPIGWGGRQWEMVITPGAQSATLSGTYVRNNDRRMKALLDLAMLAEPIEFVDLYGDTYKVMVRPFDRIPAYGNKRNRIGSVATIALVQVGED